STVKRAKAGSALLEGGRLIDGSIIIAKSCDRQNAPKTRPKRGHHARKRAANRPTCPPSTRSTDGAELAAASAARRPETEACMVASPTGKMQRYAQGFNRRKEAPRRRP